MSNKSEQIILTGLQPTGLLTIGNYLGAIKQMVKMQEDFKKNYVFIADLHAITINQDPKEIKENIRKLVAIYLACGLDPEKNVIFLQSDNPYHPAVSWLLECTAYYGETSRMIQFKEKSKKSKNLNFKVGLFTYPILMAADILIYDVDKVPVGIDQKQHVELARELAKRFNKKYGEIFKVPDVEISKEGTKIMDLLHPEKKMSKSSENQNGVIRMLDEKEVIKKKIMRATTDSDNLVKFDLENKPGISNLMTLYKAMSEKEITIEDIEKEFEGKTYKDFKEKVAEVVSEGISKIQERYNEIINSSIIDEILEKGIKETTEIAKNKYNDMKKIMGLTSEV